MRRKNQPGSQAVEVVDGLPPPRGRKPGRKPKYDWDALRPGQSVLISPSGGVPTLQSVRSMVSAVARQRGGKYSVAEMEDGRIQVYKREAA